MVMNYTLDSTESIADRFDMQIPLVKPHFTKHMIFNAVEIDKPVDVDLTFDAAAQLIWGMLIRHKEGLDYNTLRRHIIAAPYLFGRKLPRCLNRKHTNELNVSLQEFLDNELITVRKSK
jgi:hypothetical protein